MIHNFRLLSLLLIAFNVRGMLVD
ncbi:leu operon leader peptide [Xenorhabdus budapestensis]|uniref:Leu operon leader peptide n=1 Tax=Xenorhabdus budapestensis TaxID=290110 RepID=A0ABX7VTT4_XENBU|nr:leu operon leader peptide [Xenorhabdus budapestensis]